MSKLKFTIRAWLVITPITFVICLLTQNIANLFGITLPDQANLKIVRAMAGWSLNFAFLVTQIIVIMPVVEELIFRLPLRFANKLPQAAQIAIPIISAVLFTAAHYITQPFPDAAFIALLFFGLAQNYLYKKTQAILYPILNHSLFNLTNLTLLLIVPEAA